MNDIAVEVEVEFVMASQKTCQKNLLSQQVVDDIAYLVKTLVESSMRKTVVDIRDSNWDET